MKKIGSEYFRWDNSANYTHTSINKLWNFDKNKPRTKIVGYCNSKNSHFPVKKSYLVMFEYKKEDIWMHLPYIMLDTWIKPLDI